MTIEQPFPLKESGHNSTLTCKFMLKVNFPEKSLPQLLPKDQCLSLGHYECLNLTNQFQKTTLDRDCNQSLIVCVKFHLEEFTTSERCELENANLQTTSSKGIGRRVKSSTLLIELWCTSVRNLFTITWVSLSFCAGGQLGFFSQAFLVFLMNESIRREDENTRAKW